MQRDRDQEQETVKPETALARHVSARLGGCESVEEVSTRDHSCR
jgi:hypothetical protein